MRTELSGQEKNIVKVKVEFEAAEFKASLDKAIREISQKVNIPGFRKGHIPRKMLEMRLGKEALYNEAVEDMMPDAIAQIVDDYDLDLIASPSFKPGTIVEGEPVTGELTFEVMPEVKLPELGDIEVEQLRVAVTDEMLDQALLDLRKNASTLIPVTRPAADGDVVDIIVELNDGTTENDQIDLGESTLAPKVKESLIGKSPDDKLVLDLTPEAVSEEPQDGQNAEAEAEPGKYVYNVTVKEIKERILPDMTPDFYRKSLNLELDSEEAFREEIKKRLHDQLEREVINRASGTAIKLIVDRAEVEISESLLQRQIEHLKKMDDSNVRQRMGVSIDQYMEDNALNLEEYEQQLRKQSEEIVRRSLVVDAIGEKFGVTVEKEDMEKEIESRAAIFKIAPERMRELYSKNTDSLSKIANELRYDKTAKTILDHVKVKEVDELTEPAELTEKEGAE